MCRYILLREVELLLTFYVLHTSLWEKSSDQTVIYYPIKILMWEMSVRQYVRDILVSGSKC